MTWMTTAHGAIVDFTDQVGSAAALRIETIAHSLACINRFTGHTVRPISVAEHSLLVADIIEAEALGPWAALAALMHDAHKCITNDLAAPAKPVVGPGWKKFEADWELTLHSVFGLRHAFHTYGHFIRHADLIALATERRDLLPPGGPAWPCLAGIEPLSWVNLRTRDRFTWQDWRQAFTDRYHELQFACSLRDRPAHHHQHEDD